MCLMVGIVTPSIFSQQKIANKMYSDLRALDEVTYLSFSKNLIDFVDFEIDSDDEDDREVTGDLHEVKLVVYKPDFEPQKPFREQILAYLKKGKYDLVEEDENKDNTEVWIHRKGRKIYECHIIYQGEQNGVLLSFFGDFTIKDVNILKQKIEDYQ